MDLGVTQIWRETLSSSVEMGESLLKSLGTDEAQLQKIKKTFLEQDLMLLKEQYKNYNNQEAMISVSRQANENLMEILKRDQKQQNQNQNENRI
jgi:hypothetical protein